MISLAQEEGNFNQLRATLGNDVALKAYREGKLPFPDGAVIVALHWNRVPSDEDNKVFGRGSGFRCRTSREYAGDGQGLKKVPCDQRLGIR